MTTAILGALLETVPGPLVAGLIIPATGFVPELQRIGFGERLMVTGIAAASSIGFSQIGKLVEGISPDARASFATRFIAAGAAGATSSVLIGFMLRVPLTPQYLMVMTSSLVAADLAAYFLSDLLLPAPDIKTANAVVA